MKQTTKVLLSAVLTIALCVSVISGATFALFTSEASTNIAVTAGKVNVTATLGNLKTYSMGDPTTTNLTFANGGTAGFTDDAHTSIKLDKITPGDKVTFDVTVTNNSNVDIQYRLTWAVEGDLLGVNGLQAKVGTADLVNGTSAWTEWKATDTTKTQTLNVSIELPVEAGNNYQEKEATISFKVEAVQANGTDLYGKTLVNTVDELVEALKVDDNKTVALTETIDITENTDLDLNGKTVEGNLLVTSGILTVSEGTLANTDSAVSAIQMNGGEVVLNDVEIQSARHGVRVESGKLTINGGTYKAAVGNGKGTYHAINVGENNAACEVIINGGTFIGPKGTSADSGSAVNVKAGSTVTINGGNFSGGKNKTLSAGGTLIVKGGTFDQDPSAYVDTTGYKVVTSNGKYIVVPTTDTTSYTLVSTATDLSALSAKAFTGNNGTAETATIILLADIDMAGADFSAMIAQRGDTLTIVGNGHTISNAKVISGANDNTTGQASMFYCYPNSTLNISNLILKDITVTADANGTGYAAAVAGYCEGTLNLDNVDVVNATINGVKSSGAMVGHMSGTLNATGCDISGTVTLVTNTVEPNGHYAGQLIGTLAGNATFTECSTDVVVSGQLHENNIGVVYGRKVSGNSNTTNMNMTVQASSAKEFEEAAKIQNTVVKLDAGTYEFPSIAKGVTIVGGEDVVFEDTLSGTLDDVTIKDVKIKAGNAQRWAYSKGTLVFENCTFEATSVYAIHYDGLNGANITYKNCTIIGWVAIGSGAEHVTFDSCKIFGNGTYGVIRLYSPGTIKNCTFDVSAVNTTDVYQDGIHAVDCTIDVIDCTNVNGAIEDIFNISGTGVINKQ